MDVLGEGSFGCVLKPPAPCKTRRKRISNAKSEVGKVFVDKSDFDKELAAAKTVARMDPRGETILVPSEHCTTNINEIKDPSVTWTCEAFQNMLHSPRNKALYQILMPYGGVRLDDYIRERDKRMTDKEFLLLMLPVAEGLVKFEKHKYCHQDIKVANLLVTPQHKAIIIDYSLMVPYKSVYKQANIHYLHHTYFSYPPEYKSVYYAGRDEGYIRNEILRNVAVHGDGTFVARFKRAWSDSKKWVYNDLKQLQKLTNKIDVYSLGTVFVRMEPHIFVQKPVVFQKLVNKMIDINPQRRFSPVELVAAMKNIIDM